jgi:hypothetical protein
MEDGALDSIQFEYLNLIAAYMLHALAGSQSMGKLLHAFKNVRNMEMFLENNAAPTDDETPPILTRETMSYAISLSVSCVSLLANDSIVKGRASAAYERAMADLENMSDPAWHTLLRNLLVEYVTLITNPEGPAPSAPTMQRKEVLERDAARRAARAAAVNAAAAANAGGGGDGGGGGGDGDGDGDGDGGDDDADEGADEASGPDTSGPAAAKPGKGRGGGVKKKK